MEASIVELRYKMADVLKALDRREPVRITHRGKLKGIIQPASPAGKTTSAEHPFFTLRTGDKRSVDQIMRRLRGGRYHAL